MGSAQGDRHNFGQFVSRVDRGPLRGWFYKPRPVFWESYLFGKTSPVRAALLEVASDRLRKAILRQFCLQTRGNLIHSGWSKPIVKDVSTLDPYSFGTLLAYCFALGIQDLHFGNIIANKCHPIVIDIEIPWSKLSLPSETLLLPFSPKERRFSVWHKFRKTLLQDFGSVLDGYNEMIAALAVTNFEFLNKDEDSLRLVPIRVILRETWKYRPFVGPAKKPPKSWLKSEHEQLQRGDIPYFCTFIGDPKIYCYNATGDKIQVLLNTQLRQRIASFRADPVTLIDATRLTSRILPLGLLELVNFYLSDSKTKIFKYDWQNVCVVGDKTRILVSIGQRKFASTRFRPG